MKCGRYGCEREAVVEFMVDVYVEDIEGFGRTEPGRLSLCEDCAWPRRSMVAVSSNSPTPKEGT